KIHAKAPTHKRLQQHSKIHQHLAHELLNFHTERGMGVACCSGREVVEFWKGGLSRLPPILKILNGREAMAH
ncbi:MAG: hypothetical protein QMD05_10850, partial [Candidatus Brocadiaceae bacterium]|nr:hypothetical protein [Candidatus Brocadiaceae bacterium]